MADQAIASSAEGGVIRQNAFGGTYRDPFAPNTNSRRRGGGGGGGRGRGRNQSFADPEVERRAREAEEAARREQERKETERIATEEKISSSQQLAGQLKTPRPSFQEKIKTGIRNLPTKGQFIQDRSTELLQNQFNRLSPEEVRRRSLLGGYGITGQSTAEGESFSFRPTRAQLKEANLIAEREFSNLPVEERRRRERRSALLGVADLALFVPNALSGGIGSRDPETGKIVFGKPTPGGIAEEFQRKPGDSVRTGAGLALGLVGGIGGSLLRSERTLIGATRSSTLEIDRAIIRDLEKRPTRTFIIEKGTESVFITQRATPFAKQTTLGQVSRRGDQGLFVTRGVTELNVPSFKTRVTKNQFAGGGRVTPEEVSRVPDTEAFRTRGLLVTPQTKNLKTSILFKGYGISKSTGEQTFVGASNVGRINARSRPTFGTFRGYTIKEAQEFTAPVGTRFARGSRKTPFGNTFGTSLRTETITSPRVSTAAQDISRTSQANQLRSFSSQSQLSVAATRNTFGTAKLSLPQQQETKQNTRSSSGQSLLPAIIQAQKNKVGLVTPSLTSQSTRLRTRVGTAITQLPKQDQGQDLIPRQEIGSSFTPPGFPPIATTPPFPTRGGFVIPLPVKINYSEGFRPFRLTSAKPSGFGYQPSFTALVQNIRGGSLPGKVKGGYNPFVLRSINPVKRKRGRPKGSRKRR